MEIKKHIVWRGTNYGKNRKLKFWSNKIKGEGDETLPKDSPSLRGWKKVIVLKPIGAPETTFSMGFIPVSGGAKISDIIRKIKKGPFGMKLFPDDGEFFIASNTGKVGLEFVKYTDMADKIESELPVY